MNSVCDFCEFSGICDSRSTAGRRLIRADAGALPQALQKRRLRAIVAAAPIRAIEEITNTGEQVGEERPRVGMRENQRALVPRWTPEIEARLQANDQEALIAQHTMRERVGPIDAPPGFTVPCLLHIGEDDGDYSDVKRASAVIPDPTFVSLPGLGHIEAWFRSNLGVPHLRKFLAEVGES